MRLQILIWVDAHSCIMGSNFPIVNCLKRKKSQFKMVYTIKHVASEEMANNCRYGGACQHTHQPDKQLSLWQDVLTLTQFCFLIYLSLLLDSITFHSILFNPDYPFNRVDAMSFNHNNLQLQGTQIGCRGSHARLFRAQCVKVLKCGGFKSGWI